MTTTVLADVAITSGASDTSGYWHIGSATRGRIGTAKIGPVGGLRTDVSERVMSFSVQRTSTRRAGPLVEFNAGTATLVLRDDDGALDPVNLTLPAPGSEIRIRKQWGGLTYPVYRGFIKSWVPAKLSPTHAVIQVTAVDGMDLLAGVDRTALGAPVGAGETSGARIHRILDSVGWPADERSIMTGDSTVQGTLLEGSALDEAQQTTLSEGGQFYIDQQGNAVFTSRRLPIGQPSQATFGSNWAAGEIPYVGSPGVSWDTQQLINTVRATRVGGVEQVASDAASVARYRTKTHPEQGLLLQTDAEVASWARYVVRQDKDPELRYTSITLNPRFYPNLVWPQILGRQMGDRVTVVRRAPGGIVDPREVLVKSMEHTWSSAAGWRTTWGLQAASKHQFWTIGHPELGKVGRYPIAF